MFLRHVSTFTTYHQIFSEQQEKIFAEKQYTCPCTTLQEPFKDPAQNYRQILCTEKKPLRH